ncbi:hypothetical protein GCM10010124_06030 [Pilimelia terevasa]|uniref:Uncharacterized protein n=1 Tax=Pilimelia terevasa TaxID=53372 RepID=A0A8J3FF23_9ACTN|nr:hypothetical protein [Pilimelia terevasa]GGK16227.1 hypothetical protein GCM10010124_06030 [Pilimelia terevasa]
MAWLRDTDDAYWAEAPEEEEAAVLARTLRLSLAGDASILLLDPDDVGSDGEWAAYSLSSWSGMGPERFDSFEALMRDLYAGFHALRQPVGETRDAWDAEVERARVLALDGEFDEAETVLAAAQEFGRDRARLLRFQLWIMQANWYKLPLSHLMPVDPALFDDPVFAEIVPLVYADPGYAHHGDDYVAGHLRGHPRTRDLIYALDRQGAAGAVTLRFGVPEFDQAVKDIIAGLAADVAEQAAIRSDPSPAPTATNAKLIMTVMSWPAPRDHPPTSAPATAAGSEPAPAPAPERAPMRGPAPSTKACDVAWRAVMDAMRLWRPVSDNHIAPVVLLAEPLLQAVITQGRGRELLSVPRRR